jgi:outer membrane protein
MARGEDGPPVRRKTAAFLVLALLGWMPAILAAEPPGTMDAADEPQPPAVGPSAVGPFADAAPDEDPRLVEAFRLVQGNRPRAAIPHLERLVSRFPSDPRPRLGLALALFEIEDDVRARFHFERVLAAALPEPIIERVERHLEAIDARRAWQGNLIVNLAPESNAARRTDARTISIGGARFRLDPDARAKPATGLHLAGGVVHLAPLARDLRLHLGLAGNGRLYRDDDLNDVALRAELGLLMLRDRGAEWSGGISLQRRWAGGGGFYRAPGIYAGHGLRLDPVTRASVRGEVEYVEHDELPGLDGPRLRLGASLFRAQTPRLTLRARAFATRTDARLGYESGTEGGFSLGASYALTGGLVPSVDLAYANALRDARSPLFPERRREERFEIAVSVLHRSLQYRGFAPQVGIAHEMRRSNIVLYDYDTTRLLFGVSRQF